LLVLDNCRAARDVYEYRKNQPNAVHFSDKVYLEIAAKLLHTCQEMVTCNGGKPTSTISDEFAI